jgi:hypothetical protein
VETFKLTPKGMEAQVRLKGVVFKVTKESTKLGFELGAWETSDPIIPPSSTPACRRCYPHIVAHGQ